MIMLLDKKETVTGLKYQTATRPFELVLKTVIKVTLFVYNKSSCVNTQPDAQNDAGYINEDAPDAVKWSQC
ncbi:MAG: hypothetical protein CM15mP16_03420 [Candidatus Pelagibacterales bacterium]|nr:MAG: hypothetical protein CM15mP16_03420 [Pelagibacterales bacterium]